MYGNHATTALFRQTSGELTLLRPRTGLWRCVSSANGNCNIIATTVVPALSRTLTNHPKCYAPFHCSSWKHLMESPFIPCRNSAIQFAHSMSSHQFRGTNQYKTEFHEGLKLDIAVLYWIVLDKHFLSWSWIEDLKYWPKVLQEEKRGRRQFPSKWYVKPHCQVHKSLGNMQSRCYAETNPTRRHQLNTK